VRLGNQRGQALPTVLAIMLLLVLLAGGATLAVSAVLRQQTANRTLTNWDLNSQNAVAATAANIAGGHSACASSNPASPGSLFKDDFTSNIPPFTGSNGNAGRWTFIDGAGTVQQKELALTPDGQTGLSTVTPDVATSKGAAKWQDYSVSVQLRPESIQGTSEELDAYYRPKTFNTPVSYYFLRLLNGNTWVFGRTGLKSYATSPPPQPQQPGFSYDTTHWVTLELDLFNHEISAKINGIVVARHLDNNLTPAFASGSIAITAATSQAGGPQATGSRLEVDNVLVDETIPAPTPQVSLSLPSGLPSPGIPGQFYCQRLDNVATQSVSQQRVSVSVPNASTCADLNASIRLPAGGGHVRVWFIVSGPPGAQGRPVTMALGACPTPNAVEAADCGRQLSAIVPGSNPALTVLGADCTNAHPTDPPTTSDLFISTSYKGSLAPIAIRSAPVPPAGGGGSVYMTVIAARAASGQPYEESDILMPPQNAQPVLSYEGVLG
jgi:hypothetical protein